MATLPFPTPVDLSGTMGSTLPEHKGSLLFGGEIPALDQQGAGPAQMFTQRIQEMAQQTQPVSLITLTAALVTDSLSLLEARGAFADAYQAVKLLRSMQESPYEVFREVCRMIFSSLAKLPGAGDQVPVPQLVSQMRRLLPRVDLASIASPQERHYPLIQTDMMAYVTSPARPTPETPFGATAVDLSGSPDGSIATTFHGFDAQGRVIPHVATPGGGQVPMPAVHPSQMQVPEPVSTYAKLAELRAILDDYQRRTQGKRGQDLHATAARTLVSLVTKAMSDAATNEVMPRATVVAFRLAARVLWGQGETFLDRLMLGMIARLATGPRAEELAHELLRPLNTLVLTRIWQAAQRVKGEESEVFETLIRPQLEAELIRAALVADQAREVTLQPQVLRTVLTTWTLSNPLAKRAIFGNELAYNRWLAIAQAMEQAQGRRHTPLFAVLQPHALPGDMPASVEFAPMSLARFMSDPYRARALLLGLRTPATLAHSGIAMRLREESIEEMQHEQVTSQP